MISFLVVTIVLRCNCDFCKISAENLFLCFVLVYETYSIHKLTQNESFFQPDFIRLISSRSGYNKKTFVKVLLQQRF